MNFGQITARIGLDATKLKTDLGKLKTVFRNAFSPQAVQNVGNTNNALNKTKMHLKDIERIVGGILISQAFYKGAQEINNASAALMTFMGNMEKAQIAMEYFLGSPEESTAFINEMKSFAAETAFSTEQALVLSRRLMAAQFEPKNVRSVMETLNDAAAVGGGTAEQMDRVVLALSQIKTNGKLAGQEMRQLAEAQIPIYKILQEELRLTGEQVMNIGDQKINGDLAVEAILRGLEKRYKGAAQRIADTVPGMLETIRDDMLMIGNGMFEGPYLALRDNLRKIRDTLERARYTIFKKGFGGLFEQIFPPEAQQTIRIFLGSIASIVGSVKMMVKSLAPALGALGLLITETLNMIILPLAAVLRVVTNVIDIALEAVPALNIFGASLAGLLIAQFVAKGLLILWRAAGLGMICTAVAKAVRTLTSAIVVLGMAIYRTPILGFFAALGTVASFWMLSTDTAARGFKKLQDSIAGLAGFTADKIFAPKEEPKKDLDDYNSGLGDTSKGLDKVGKDAKDTKKKLDNLFQASFDELYQIPDKLKDTGSGLKDSLDLGEIDATVPINGLDGGFGGGLPSFDIGDPFKDFWQNTKDYFTKKLPKLLKEFFTDTLPGWIGKGWKWIKDNGPEIWEDFVDGLKEGFGSMWEETSDAFEQIGDLFVDGWLFARDATVNTFNDIKSDIKSRVDTTLTLIRVFCDNVKTTVSNRWDEVKNDTREKWDAFRQSIVDKIDAVKTHITDTLTSLKGSIDTKWTEIKTNVSTKWEEIRKTISDKVDLIVTKASAMPGTIKTNVINGFNTAKSEFTNKWQEIRNNISSKVDSIISNVTGMPGRIRNSVASGWNNIKNDALNKFDDMRAGFNTKAEAIKGIFTGMKEAVGGTFSSLWNVVKIWLNAIIGGINGLIGKLNDFEINIPSMYVPGFGAIGGRSIGLPYIPRVPYLAKGGVVMKDQLVRVGEGNRKEVVIPIENSDYMKPYSKAVASDLAEMLGGGVGQQQQQTQPVMYVHTLIADDRSLAELDRRMKVVRRNEELRGAF
jgi:tape measure domain-containing protein